MNEDNKNKVRFFRWTGSNKNSYYFRVWKVREDGSGEGIYFNGKMVDRESGNLEIERFVKDKYWEEIPASEGFLIF